MTLKSKPPTANCRKLLVIEVGFFLLQGVYSEVLSGSDIALIWKFWSGTHIAMELHKCSHVMMLLWLVIMLTRQPYHFHLSFCKPIPDFCHQFGSCVLGFFFLFFFLFTFFNLSIESAHLIVTHLIEKYNWLKKGNAIFVEGLACTSTDLSPILQTAGSYLRCKAILNLTAVHDNVFKIRTCTAQAPLSREISFVFIAF